MVDDVVIYDNDRGSHMAYVHQFLQRCQERQISPNRDKCSFVQTQVTFAGFQLSSEGYHVDSSITNALSNFPAPTNRSDLRSFFDLANQLSSSTDIVSTLLLPMCTLLSTKHDFLWSQEHDKVKLMEVPTLAYSNLAKETRLCTDASRQGLGFVLWQLSDAGQWNLVQAGSHFLMSAESRYAMELLEIAWAVTKCHVFLGGPAAFSGCHRSQPSNPHTE